MDVSITAEKISVEYYYGPKTSFLYNKFGDYEQINFWMDPLYENTWALSRDAFMLGTSPFPDINCKEDFTEEFINSLNVSLISLPA